MCSSVCPCCSFLFSFLNFLTSFPLPYLPVLISLWTFLLVVRLLTTEVFIWSFLFPTSFHFSFTILSLYWIQFLYRELASYFIPFLLLLLFELFDRSYNHSVEWFIIMWLVTFSRHALLVFHVPFISALGVVWNWSSLLVRCFSFSWNLRSFSLVMHSIQERWDFYWELQVLSLVFWISYYLSEQTPYPRVKVCLFLILTSAVFWCVSLNLAVLSWVTGCAVGRHGGGVWFCGVLRCLGWGLQGGLSYLYNCVALQGPSFSSYMCSFSYMYLSALSS